MFSHVVTQGSVWLISILLTTSKGNTDYAIRVKSDTNRNDRTGPCLTHSSRSCVEVLTARCRTGLERFEACQVSVGGGKASASRS